MEKYLHVSCLVKQQNLYDLLHALEVHKIGNVEVRAVSRMLNGSTEVEPKKGPGRGNYPRKPRRVKNVLETVRSHMKIGVVHNYNELARTLNANSKSVANAMRHLMNSKPPLVKKVSPGLYERIREDAE